VEARPEGARGTVAVRGAEAPRLDTLAQLDQRPADDHEKLMRRARAKFLSAPLAISLAELHSPLEKSYRNTVYCAGLLVQDETGKLKGHYCGNRWCLVCNRVRTARAFNRYLPVMAKWTDPQLVTLTLPNVPAGQLSAVIGKMVRDLVAIGRSVRRTDRLPLRALRKLECTYNPSRNDYHPHFHLAVEGRLTAEAIRGRWLKMYPQASPAAQDVRPCDIGSLRELFKYFTKLLAPRPNDSTSRGVAPSIALDVIFSAMKGRRVYQPMGFRVAAAPSVDENAVIGNSGNTASPKRLGENVMWEWLQDLHDWIDLSSGDVLTGYEPTQGFRDLVKSIGSDETEANPPRIRDNARNLSVACIKGSDSMQPTYDSLDPTCRTSEVNRVRARIARSQRDGVGVQVP